LYSQAVELARRMGDREMEQMALSNLALLQYNLGLYKFARDGFEQALAFAEAVGNRRGRAYCLCTLAAACYWLHDESVARRLQQEALVEATAMGDAYLIACCRFFLGWMAERVGDYADAVRHNVAAMEECKRMGLVAMSTDPLAGLARCALAEGRLEEARQRSVDVWTYLREHGTAGIGEPTLCFLTVAEIFDALGQTGDARGAVEAGYQELMERADKIGNLQWRKSFMENVEFNRELVEMWERMQH
jgi:tetratricopeptide (TPR) repeat protein